MYFADNFGGYSHVYGGFWKTAGDESQHTVTYPYSEAGLQSAPLLWLVSLAVCEQLPGSAPAVEALVRSAAHDLNGLGSGDNVRLAHLLEVFQEDSGLAMDLSPYLNLQCDADVLRRRAAALKAALDGNTWWAWGVRQRLHIALLDLTTFAVLVLESLARRLQPWLLMYLPAAYLFANACRHVDSDLFGWRRLGVVAAYAYSPFVVADAIAQGLERALTASPPLLDLGEPRPFAPTSYLLLTAVCVCRRAWAVCAARCEMGCDGVLAAARCLRGLVRVLAAVAAAPRQRHDLDDRCGG